MLTHEQESLPKQKRGACGHKRCTRRVTCKVAYNQARYKERRKLGHPWWSASGRTPSGFLSQMERDRERSKKNRAMNKKAVQQYRAKMKELHGGRIDLSSTARARWIIAKEGLHYERS